MTQPRPMQTELKKPKPKVEWPKLEDLPVGTVFSHGSQGNLYLIVSDDTTCRVNCHQDSIPVICLREFNSSTWKPNGLRKDYIPTYVYKAILVLELVDA